MIACLLGATLYATFGFAGGSDLDLVRAIDKACHKTAAILAEPSRKWKKVEFRYVAGDASDLFRILNAKLPVDAGGKPSSLSRAPWPRFMFDQGVRPPKEPWGSSENKVDVSGGKVDVSCEGPVKVEQLLEGLSKPSVVHWFFKGAGMVVSAHGATEKEYVQAIANALGAQLVIGPNQYRFEVNPGIMRRRGVALNNNISNVRNPFLRELALLTSEALTHASDSEILSCYQDRGNVVALSGSSDFELQATCRDYVEACFPPTGNLPLPSIDFSRPCTVLLYASGHAATRWKSTNPKTGAIVTFLN